MTQAKPLPLRKQQKNYTRQRLLQVSGELVVKHGTHATGIDDIARAAGTSRATVYTHFTGKYDIIAALLSEMWDRALILAEDFDALPDASAGNVRGWLEKVFASWDNCAESTKVVLREMPDAQTDCQQRLEAQATALVNSRLKWEHFTADEAERRALLLLQQLHHSLLAWYYGGWQQDREALLTTLTDVWCATLQPQR
jgi:AcrR family transcriptional regulator